MLAPRCQFFVRLAALAACTPVLGFGFGLGLSCAFPLSVRVPSVRSVPSSVPAPRELKCTCVPCLPDLFCFKCGHKSRDCPRLAQHFKSHTNTVSNVR